MLLTDVLTSGIRIGTPLAFAGLGETFSQRAGVINVQLEGMMLVGAFTGVVATHHTGNPWLGLLAAMVGSMLLALIHGLVSINLGGDQVISGIALNLVALGATSFLLDVFFPGYSATTEVGFQATEIPGLSGVPFIGDVLFRQSLPVYALYFLIPLSIIVLFRTPWGIRVIAAGENPHAADTVGVSVNRVRYQALFVAGALAGLAGGFLALTQLRAFVDNMIQGRGFIALAAVLFGNWRPIRVVFAATLFGVIDALQLRLQAIGVGIPSEAMTMLPYLLTVIVLAGFMGRSRPPRYFGVPFVRGGG